MLTIVNMDLNNITTKHLNQNKMKELKTMGYYINVTREDQLVQIKDNVGYGEWDWEMLANEWDAEELNEWGLEVPGFDMNADGLGTDFTLPDGDKAPFQQMTFTLADEQATQIKNAIADIKETEEYKYAETMGNENSNGNALYLIIMQWAEQRK